jgi:hypothetical protein
VSSVLSQPSSITKFAPVEPALSSDPRNNAIRATCAAVSRNLRAWGHHNSTLLWEIPQSETVGCGIPRKRAS